MRLTEHVAGLAGLPMRPRLMSHGVVCAGGGHQEAVWPDHGNLAAGPPRTGEAEGEYEDVEANPPVADWRPEIALWI